MKVLVTGHHGYIGSVMAPLLHDAGLTVAGIDTFFYEGCDLVADRLDVPSARGDVRDLSTDALTGFDAVVHLAALSNDPLGDLNPRWTRRRPVLLVCCSRHPAVCTAPPTSASSSPRRRRSCR
jgi:nucleoside-diphosphate-sugar epimerase